MRICINQMKEIKHQNHNFIVYTEMLRKINKSTYTKIFGLYSKQPKFYTPSYIIQFFKTKPFKNYKKSNVKRNFFFTTGSVQNHFPKVISNRKLLLEKSKLFFYFLNFNIKLIDELKINYRFFIQPKFV
nr:hypothetical protein CparaKRNrm2_p042 [Cryptomonas paramecium]